MMKKRPRSRERKEHYATLTRVLLHEPAWQALPPTAKALYPYLRLEWHGPQFNNNGKIQFSVRQAAAALGIGINCAARASQSLQAKGFVVVTELACLGISGAARAPSLELTDLALPHAKPQVGRKLYREWREGHDFPIAKHAANNPEGRNGRRRTRSSKQGRTCLRIGDVRAEAVIESKTARHRNGDVRGSSKPCNVVEMKTSLVTRSKGAKAVPDLSLGAAVRLCPW